MKYCTYGRSPTNAGEGTLKCRFNEPVLDELRMAVEMNIYTSHELNKIIQVGYKYTYAKTEPSLAS
jgi:hypothetical protein